MIDQAASPPPSPTRIIKKPYRLSCTGGRGNPRWVYPCDDGRDYTRKELAALAGITTNQISDRIYAYGWDSLKILKNSADFMAAKKRETKERQALAQAEIGQGGNDEWHRLSGSERPQNLARLRPLGIFERQGQGHGR